MISLKRVNVCVKSWQKSEAGISHEFLQSNDPNAADLTKKKKKRSEKMSEKCRPATATHVMTPMSKAIKKCECIAKKMKRKG